MSDQFDWQTTKSIDTIPASEWDALWPSDYPFTQHAFLSALETSGSVDNETVRDSGWRPFHLILYKNEKLIAAAPAYLKSHSYGEYVFDWSWANAYHQNGLDYYPKLLNAIPFTPATGPRIAFSPALSENEKSECIQDLFRFIKNTCGSMNCSGFHSLFPDAACALAWKDLRLHVRYGYQFHWFNQHYVSFDDFLSRFSSRKRKNIRKEREKVLQSDLEIKMRDGTEISTEEWERFYQLYQITYLKRSGHSGYLDKNFFHNIASAMPKNILLASAHNEEEMVAAALYFRDSDTLYGRYWGSTIELDGLHFECCYYQGIEYAIKNELKRFDPGAQGEHKIQRGFTPIKTQSVHYIQHPSFDTAIANFVAEEAKDIEHYLNHSRTFLPFKNDHPIVEIETLL